MTEPRDAPVAEAAPEPALPAEAALDPAHPDPNPALTAEQTQAQKLEEMFGGRRGLLDGAIPPIVFVATNAVRHDVRQAAYAAVASAIVLLVVRLISRGPTRHVFNGVFGVALSAFIAARTGKAKNFFIPGIVLNSGYFIAFVVSVLLRKPIVGLVLKQFSDKPAAWHDHPTVRRAYSELTLIWALMYGIRVLVQGVLLRLDEVNLLAVSKLVLGYPPLVLVLAITMPYLSWRTRGVPVAAKQHDPKAMEPEVEGMPGEPAG